MPHDFAKAALADAETVFPLRPNSGWGLPDMSIVDGGRRTPPSLPPAMFGTVWPECEKLAKDKGAPADYVALAYIAVAASIIGGKRKARPYQGATWVEPAIIWLGLVGDPSSNKSPAQDPFIKILKTLERGHSDEHQARLNDWQGDCERAKAERSAWQEMVKSATKEGLSTPTLPNVANEPSIPRRRRLMVQDATPESMAEVLAGNPQGTLLLRDELDGWLSSFDRYNPGGRSFWLESYRGGSYVVDRKAAAQPLSIDFNGVSIVGGIQPAKLSESLLGKVDDGLPARFLWCWPDRPPLCRPTCTADLEAIEAALARLEGLAWAFDATGIECALTLDLEPDAADVFECLQRGHRAHGDEAAGLLKSFVGKLDGMALRLALVCELARWAYEGGPEPKTIRRETVEAVGDFLESYAIPMAARVYGDAALPPVERNAATLARYIQRHGLKLVNARDIRREYRLPGLREADAVNQALEALVDADWLRSDGTRKGDTPGRARADYTVNPAVLEG